jgi:polyisoprenyl-phosphate glycosyltransferase
MDEPYLSVVAPCYNEEDALPEFYRRVTAVCRDLGVDYEIVLINDGSRDNTWEIMRSLAKDDPAVVSVNLSRNHGQQLALTAGLSVCRGRRILIIDADLQDPPELLPEMLQRMDAGADVVYGQRRRRKGESRFKLATSALFYRLISGLSSVKLPLDTGDFRLISRRVLDAFLLMPERARFIRGMISWIGYRQEALLYDRDARYAGDTKYPVWTLMKLAIDAITGFSTKPLHFATFAGGATVLMAIVMIGLGAFNWLTGATEATLMVLGWLTLLGGVQLLGQGVMGAYLAQLSEQSRGRPLFFIDRIERFEREREFKPRGEVPEPDSTVAA